MSKQTVYLLWHEHDLEGCDEIKLLGVFTERKLAEESQRYFETQLGFCDYLDGFMIEDVEMDRRLWSEGFVLVS